MHRMDLRWIGSNSSKIASKADATSAPTQTAQIPTVLQHFYPPPRQRVASHPAIYSGIVSELVQLIARIVHDHCIWRFVSMCQWRDRCVQSPIANEMIRAKSKNTEISRVPAQKRSVAHFENHGHTLQQCPNQFHPLQMPKTLLYSRTRETFYSTVRWQTHLCRWSRRWGRRLREIHTGWNAIEKRKRCKWKCFSTN